MNKHIAKIFIIIIVVGTAIYAVGEFQNIIDSISGTISSNNFIKFNTARNSDYFENIISVGKKYNEK